MAMVTLNVPLYRACPLPDERLMRTGNTGLWYYKFCNTWEVEATDASADWSSLDPETGASKIDKAKWIGKFEGRSIGDEKLLCEARERLENLVTELQGQMLVFKNCSRFVTGMGLSHPIENGFLWHHTLGVPYLPATSVKGIVRTWAAQQDDSANLIERIFGAQPNADKKSVGGVIFYDAIPLGMLKVETDITTPHYGPYYQEEGKQPPGDWYSPVPIPFLTVAENHRWVFSIAPRKPENQNDLQLVIEWLNEALQWAGAGAKTAVGYGRFVRDLVTEQTLEEARLARIEEERQKRLLAAMPPIRREMEEDSYSTDIEAFMRAINEKWLKRLENADEPLANKQEIAKHLRDWYLANKPAQWKKPNKKNRQKLRVIRRYLDS